MESNQYFGELTLAKREKNILAGMLGIALIVILIMAYTLTLQINKRREHFMPPEISKPFWISGTDASPEYFEELAQFVGSLTTNITPETASMSCNQFLLYILPKDRDKFRAKCDLEISRVKRDNVSQMFSLREVRADAKNKRVALFGTTLSFVGGKQLTKEAEVFLIEFAHYNGRFYVINHEKTDPEDPFHAKK